MKSCATIISVIIPIYKVESFLRECIDSILSSSYPHIEIILVDDGSPDSSGRICDEYALQEPRVKVIHKSNGGAGDARNVGVLAAKGDYILFVDGDDYWRDSNAVAEAVTLLDTHPEIDILCFDCALLTSRGVKESLPLDVSQINGRSKVEALSYLIGEDRLRVTPWSKFVRRKILIDNNISFKCGIRSEDYDWTLQLLIHSQKIWAMESNFYVYRVWNGSVTTNISESHLLDIMNIIVDWNGRLPREVTSLEERTLYFDLLGYIYGVLLSLIHIAPTKELLSTARTYTHLLNWHRSRKVHYLAELYRIFGFNLTWRILALFRLIRRV